MASVIKYIKYYDYLTNYALHEVTIWVFYYLLLRTIPLIMRIQSQNSAKLANTNDFP